MRRDGRTKLPHTLPGCWDKHTNMRREGPVKLHFLWHLRFGEGHCITFTAHVTFQKSLHIEGRWVNLYF